MCSGSEAGSYLRLEDFVYHPPLGWRVIKEKKKIFAFGDWGVPTSILESIKEEGEAREPTRVRKRWKAGFNRGEYL
jgi:hypothetical protein